jgi:hypothetical protein
MGINPDKAVFGIIFSKRQERVAVTEANLQRKPTVSGWRKFSHEAGVSINPVDRPQLFQCPFLRLGHPAFSPDKTTDRSCNYLEITHKYSLFLSTVKRFHKSPEWLRNIGVR